MFRVVDDGVALRASIGCEAYVLSWHSLQLLIVSVRFHSITLRYTPEYIYTPGYIPGGILGWRTDEVQVLTAQKESKPFDARRSG
jgi:hypothetical protein